MRRHVDARDAAALEQFVARLGKSGETAARAGRLARLAGGQGVPGEARELLTNERSRAALDELESLWRVVESLNLGEGFSVDLSDVSGLDYYTGLVFKIYVEGRGARVGSGGRYDELTANFGRREPAVGFVLDLDALTEALARGGDFDSQNGERDASSINISEDMTERFREAKQRRARGERIRLEQNRER